MKFAHWFTPLNSSQRGVALFSTLIMLVVIMFIGIAVVLTSRGQFGMSGNSQYKALAFSSAESAVVVAEQWLSAAGNINNPNFETRAAKGGLYPVGYLTANGQDPLTMTWTDANSEATANSSQRYIIELLAENQTLMSSGDSIGSQRTSGTCNSVNTYRILGRGVSQRGATEFVQSIYSVLNC
jgi:Tfp pilus assembly protein PilX